MTDTHGPGRRDVQTVTPAGLSTVPTIDGVVVHTPPTHVDHRGWVFEIHNLDPALGIDWPCDGPILSDRDRANPRITDIPADIVPE